MVGHSLLISFVANTISFAGGIGHSLEISFVANTTSLVAVSFVANQNVQQNLSYTPCTTNDLSILTKSRVTHQWPQHERCNHPA